MASLRFCASSATLSSFEGLRPSENKVSQIHSGRVGFGKRSIKGLSAKAATVVAPTTGTQVIYSKYAGTEIEFNGTNHLLLKEDDIVGILHSDAVKDLKPLNDRVLIKVAPAEEKTAGGLLLTEATKEKPSIGMVVAVGPGPLDEEGSRKRLSVAPGDTVLYSKYVGNEFKGSDGVEYMTLRASDIMDVLSSSS